MVWKPSASPKSSPRMSAQFVQIGLAVDQPGSVLALARHLLGVVVALVEVAGDHFQQVGRRDHALEGPELVDQEGHVDLGRLQDLQRLQHRGRLRDEGRASGRASRY